MMLGNLMKVHLLNMLIVSDVIESNDSTSGGSPSESGIGSSSRTLSDSKCLQPANQAPSMHGNYSNSYGTTSEIF